MSTKDRIKMAKEKCPHLFTKREYEIIRLNEGFYHDLDLPAFSTLIKHNAIEIKYMTAQSTIKLYNFI